MRWQMSRNPKENGCPRRSNNIHGDTVSEYDCMIEAWQGCPCGCSEGSEKEKRRSGRSQKEREKEMTWYKNGLCCIPLRDMNGGSQSMSKTNSKERNRGNFCLYH